MAFQRCSSGGGSMPELNNIQTWLRLGGVTGSYATMQDILADTTALNKLMTSGGAVNYLVGCDDFITEICASSNGMSAIGASNYCANSLLSHNNWLDGIGNSTYMESVLNVKVPTMTGASTPSGTVSCSTAYSGTNGWYAFDKNLSTQYISNSTGDDLYVQYMFTSKIHAYSAYVAVTSNVSTAVNMTYKIQGSNNGSSWTDIIDNQTVSVINTSNTIKKHAMNKEYKYFRLLKVSSTSTIRFCVPEFNIYGRADV